MLYAERAELIMQQLQLQLTVKVGELRQLLHVSADTVRRDLKAMEQEGLINIHGGACLPESIFFQYGFGFLFPDRNHFDCRAFPALQLGSRNHFRNAGC